jgi:hypothetical protein
MNILEFNKDIKSYKLPIAKIVVCTLLIIFLFIRKSIYQIKIEFLANLEKSLCLGVAIFMVYCLGVAVMEILVVRNRNLKVKEKEKTVALAKQGVYCTEDKVLSILQKPDRDFVSVIIIFENKKIEFFKLFESYDVFIYNEDPIFDEMINLSQSDVKMELEKYKIHEKICVVEVNGIAAQKYFEEPVKTKN